MPKEASKIPKHIGIIMDGNRRWATERGLAPIRGHEAGYHTLKKVSSYCFKRGVKILTVYAFSNENWQRPRVEIKFLLGLFSHALKHEIAELHQNNIRLNFLGRIREFPVKLRQEIEQAINTTKNNTRGMLNLAINYGGRAEIIDAVKRIIAKGVSLTRLTESLFSKYMYAAALPEPDLIIRTSGEQRLSGFLLWESAYAELFFSRKNWPDFTEQDLDAAIEEYGQRQRRFGK